MDDARRPVDEIRNGRNDLENALIAEYEAGRITRREFVRRGTVLGMSISLLSILAAACGGTRGEAGPEDPMRPGGRP